MLNGWADDRRHVVFAHLEVAGAARLEPDARFALRHAPFGGD
jgi:hypothetical protein